MPVPIGDAEILTQYVPADAVAPARPVAEDQDAVSVLVGRLRVEAAAERIRSTGRPATGDRVRHAPAGVVRARGFTLTRTPTPRNPLHVSLTRGGGWDDAAAQLLDRCFVDAGAWVGTDA
ncbi:hypothetical protein [Nocardioides sp.]|uniref:hypothetical protein n=1 Tax=Nocardioides sp. TaxID=35761 RepID=UPI0035137984